MKNTILAILVVALVFGSSANAADFRSGLYIGAHGLVLSDGEVNDTSSTDYGYSESKSGNSMDLNGGVEVGARAGYNGFVPINLPTLDRRATLLFGLELNGSYGGPDGATRKTITGTDSYEDGDKVDFTSTQGKSLEMTWNAEIRARAGFAYKSMAVYAFGGPVIAGVKEGSSYKTVYSDGNMYSNQDELDHFAFGYTVGGGFEWQVAKHVSVLAEVAYRDLSVEESKYSYNDSLGGGDESRLNDTSISVGMNFRF